MIILFSQTGKVYRRLGVYRVATALREAGYDVQVIDYLESWNVDVLINLLDKLPIEWVGISSTYSHTVFRKRSEIDNLRLTDLAWEDECKLLEFLKGKNIPILLGGNNTDKIKNFIQGYYINLGQGDNSIIKFHEHIKYGSELKYININNNKVIMADDDYGDINLDKIHVDYHDSDFISTEELLPIEISRGCIFRCKYCSYPYIGKKPGTYMRCKESIKEEIYKIYNKYRVKNFIFVDDTLNDSIEKLELIKAVRDETGIDFTFWAYGRLDLLAAHPKMIDLIGEIGWSSIAFGIETFNKKSGSAVGKGMNPDKGKQTLIELRNRYPDLIIQILLIAGLPHSSKEEIKDTIDWCLDQNIDGLEISPLALSNPEVVVNTSLLSKNPKKYGYTVTPSNHAALHWKNDYWQQQEAAFFAKKMKDYFDAEYYKKHGKPSGGWILKHARKTFREKFGNEAKWTDFDDGVDYVKNKTELLEGIITDYETRRIC